MKYSHISRRLEKTMAGPSFTVFLLLLMAHVHKTIQKSDPAGSTYKAGVVEFRPVFYSGDASRTLNENADKCTNFIEIAASKNADIVVFPELSLPTVKFPLRPFMDPWTTLIPHPSENYTPCTNSSIPISEALRKISCAAAQNDIYVVVNLLEKLFCKHDDCPSDGVCYYISSVVFDRQGTIISRARKNHLLDEYNILNVLPTLECSTFETDFGVTFANVICFDILYEEPTLTQTRDLNITDIIFTSGWTLLRPFLTTIQMEAGWAYAEDVNMLAAGYNKADQAYSGTGIYAGRQGIVTAILSFHDHEEVLVAEVKKKSKNTGITPRPEPSRDNRRGRKTSDSEDGRFENEARNEVIPPNYGWLYYKLDNFDHKVITNDGFVVERLRQNGIECEFRLNITNLKPPLTYHLLIHEGADYFGKIAMLGMRFCAVVQCANESINSCGRTHDSSVIFHSVTVSAMFIDNNRTLTMPNTLGTNMLPLENFQFDEFKYGRYRNTSISLTSSSENLITFGLFGRNFEIDRLDFGNTSTVYNRT